MRLFYGDTAFVPGVMIVFAARRCGANGRIVRIRPRMVKTIGLADQAR
jgi:hypothetical protein